MSSPTTLKSIVRFVNVAAGATAVLPHNLNIDERAVVPDTLFPSVPGFTISGDATNVTVTNTTAGVLSLDVLCEHWHSIERDLGANADGNSALTPQPWVQELGDGGLNAAAAVLGFGARSLELINEGGSEGTFFLHPWNGPNVVNGEIAMVAPRPGTVRHLWVRQNAGPGAAVPVVYTVLKNGVPTTLTCTLAGNVLGNASDIAHSFTVAEGDRISMTDTVAAEGGLGADAGLEVIATMRFEA